MIFAKSYDYKNLANTEEPALTIRINYQNKKIQLSVRDLAFLGGKKEQQAYFSFKNLELGQEIHQKIQSEKLSLFNNYKTEYFVKYKFKLQGWDITIRGRADLLAITPDVVKIEEIKTIFIKEFDGSPEDRRITPFIVQLQCYAWILYQIEEKLPEPSLLLILYNRYDKKQYDFPIAYKNMSLFIKDNITQIIQYEEIKQEFLRKKINSLSKLHFPFPFRPYQKEIIEKIELALENYLNLIIEAPSGIGKTVVSLYPVFPHVIRENTKLFFLTAKATQRQIVEHTLQLFKDQGIDFLSITLKAKEKMCTNTFYFCHEDYCPFLRNHLNNYPEEYISSFVNMRGIILPEMIEKEALTSEAFCPFEVALDISLDADVIIGDYNYVFHPRVLLQRYFGEQVSKQKPKYYLIVDEAHNLVDRSLSYYSHSLSQKDVLKLKSKMKELKRSIQGVPLPLFLPPVLEREFRKLRTEYGTEITTHILKNIDSRFFKSLLIQYEEKTAQYIQFLLEKGLHWPDDPILEFYYHLRDFVETIFLTKNNDEFSILFNSHKGKIKILCKDASFFLNQRLKQFKTALAISATITPFPFYRDLLGFPVDKTIYDLYPSPFPTQNRKVLIVPKIDTRYNQRVHFYDEIANFIHEVVKIKKGKYFAFFPSFEYAKQVTKLLKPIEGLVILEQNSLMHDSDRNDFINNLERQSFVLAIAVTSGIFAEGIDLPGLLDGIFIISPSLPVVSFERELLKDYYEEHYGGGFTYAYQFPGLTKTFQAAGRLIRTASDKGIIIFIGRRFASTSYINYFPPYYYQNSPRELISSDPIQEIKNFWNNIKKESTTSKIK